MSEKIPSFTSFAWVTATKDEVMITFERLIKFKIINSISNI